MIQLEVPVYTVEAALLAAKHGADRLELCADVGEGGTTPSVGLLTYLKERVSIPIFVMIRPRGGDFCYSPEEVTVMEYDIRLMGMAGADGFVFGILDKDGAVNAAECRRLIATAEGKPCTFHRAIDVSKDLMESLDTIIRCGFRRVLSSGGRNSVDEGFDNLKEMFEAGGDAITVMPGGGTRPEHLKELALTGQLREVHSSCKAYRESTSTFFSPYVQLSADPEGFRCLLTVSPDKVLQYRQAIKAVAGFG
ncbi:copper homeostasis protein CutC [Lunatimonas salinarum]|uniref:copper homeostasis protein CutC n=1 Tax=Lunatimonas salinarum TaxID=1774590 RepID=UPI001AE026A9|nr:copper homeostasis protein CutC [Lunatimonas salinarum]